MTDIINFGCNNRKSNNNSSSNSSSSNNNNKNQPFSVAGSFLQDNDDCFLFLFNTFMAARESRHIKST